MSTKKMPKNAENFFCQKCNFKCSKQSNFDKHLLTAKHKNRTILNEKMPKNAEYVCECGKSYSARNSLWYHKKKCDYIFLNDKNNEHEQIIKPESESNNVEICKQLLSSDYFVNHFDVGDQIELSITIKSEEIRMTMEIKHNYDIVTIPFKTEKNYRTDLKWKLKNDYIVVPIIQLEHDGLQRGVVNGTGSEIHLIS